MGAMAGENGMTGREAPRQRSVHCDRSERETIRGKAAAAGKTVSRFLLDLTLADDPDRYLPILGERTAEDRRQQRQATLRRTGHRGHRRAHRYRGRRKRGWRFGCEARTRTSPCHARPRWLADAHTDLDAAAAAVHGRDAGISDDDALCNLLALNSAVGRTDKR